MHPFKFTWAGDRKEALNIAADTTGARYLGGGTNLVDLMKLNIERPASLIDISALDLKTIEQSSDGSLRIGALVTNSDLAYHNIVRANYPLLSQAILAGASAQLRNRATTGGNLMQRTRCPYFYDTAYRCNKRVPGAGCDALHGYNRSHAVLGTSDQCIATHPSDMCVALVALDAMVQLQSNTGTRSVPLQDFHLLPGVTPDKETILKPGELITHITLPAQAAGTKQYYLKMRDRSSYEFALTSAAVSLYIHDGHIIKARIAMGGVGTKPWRSKEAEYKLEGSRASRETYLAAADAAMSVAKAQKHNSFKIELAKRTLVHALETAEGIV